MAVRDVTRPLALGLSLALVSALPAEAQQRGQAFPELALPSLGQPGQLTRVSSFRGQKLLLLEFASW